MDSKTEESEETDIYSNLPNFHYDQNLLKLETENKSLHEQVKVMKEDIERLSTQLAKCEKEKTALAKNISTLFISAKHEVDRKNKTIEELRSIRDNGRMNYRRPRRMSELTYESRREDVASYPKGSDKPEKIDEDRSSNSNRYERRSKIEDKSESSGSIKHRNRQLNVENRRTSSRLNLRSAMSRNRLREKNNADNRTYDKHFTGNREQSEERKYHNKRIYTMMKACNVEKDLDIVPTQACEAQKDDNGVSSRAKTTEAELNVDKPIKESGSAVETGIGEKLVGNIDVNVNESLELVQQPAIIVSSELPPTDEGSLETSEMNENTDEYIVPTPNLPQLLGAWTKFSIRKYKKEFGVSPVKPGQVRKKIVKKLSKTNAKEKLFSEDSETNKCKEEIGNVSSNRKEIDKNDDQSTNTDKEQKKCLQSATDFKRPYEKVIRRSIIQSELKIEHPSANILNERAPNVTDKQSQRGKLPDKVNVLKANKFSNISEDLHKITDKEENVVKKTNIDIKHNKQELEKEVNVDEGITCETELIEQIANEPLLEPNKRISIESEKKISDGKDKTEKSTNDNTEINHLKSESSNSIKQKCSKEEVEQKTSNKETLNSTIEKSAIKLVRNNACQYEKGMALSSLSNSGSENIKNETEKRKLVENDKSGLVTLASEDTDMLKKLPKIRKSFLSMFGESPTDKEIDNSPMLQDTEKIEDKSVPEGKDCTVVSENNSKTETILNIDPITSTKEMNLDNKMKVDTIEDKTTESTTGQNVLRLFGISVVTERTSPFQSPRTNSDVEDSTVISVRGKVDDINTNDSITKSPKTDISRKEVVSDCISRINLNNNTDATENLGLLRLSNSEVKSSDRLASSMEVSNTAEECNKSAEDKCNETGLNLLKSIIQMSQNKNEEVILPLECVEKQNKQITKTDVLECRPEMKRKSTDNYLNFIDALKNETTVCVGKTEHKFESPKVPNNPILKICENTESQSVTGDDTLNMIRAFSKMAEKISPIKTPCKLLEEDRALMEMPIKENESKFEMLKDQYGKLTFENVSSEVRRFKPSSGEHITSEPTHPLGKDIDNSKPTANEYCMFNRQSNFPPESQPNKSQQEAQTKNVTSSSTKLTLDSNVTSQKTICQKNKIESDSSKDTTDIKCQEVQTDTSKVASLLRISYDSSSEHCEFKRRKRSWRKSIPNESKQELQTVNAASISTELTPDSVVKKKKPESDSLENTTNFEPTRDVVHQQKLFDFNQKSLVQNESTRDLKQKSKSDIIQLLRKEQLKVSIQDKSPSMAERVRRRRAARLNNSLTQTKEVNEMKQREINRQEMVKKLGASSIYRYGVISELSRNVCERRSPSEYFNRRSRQAKTNSTLNTKRTSRGTTPVVRRGTSTVSRRKLDGRIGRHPVDNNRPSSSSRHSNAKRRTNERIPTQLQGANLEAAQLCTDATSIRKTDENNLETIKEWKLNPINLPISKSVSLIKRFVAEEKLPEFTKCTEGGTSQVIMTPTDKEIAQVSITDSENINRVLVDQSNQLPVARKLSESPVNDSKINVDLRTQNSERNSQSPVIIIRNRRHSPKVLGDSGGTFVNINGQKINDSQPTVCNIIRKSTNSPKKLGDSSGIVVNLSDRTPSSSPNKPKSAAGTLTKPQLGNSNNAENQVTVPKRTSQRQLSKVTNRPVNKGDTTTKVVRSTQCIVKTRLDFRLDKHQTSYKNGQIVSIKPRGKK